MTVRRWIWIDGVKHNFESLSEVKKKECSLKMHLQILKSQGRKPTDKWLDENPVYAEHWEGL